MHSIRTKITALTLAAILISIVSFALIGKYFTTLESNRMAAEALALTCENRKDSLNEYLNSIQQSVNMISRYAVDSLDSVALAEGGVLGASGNSMQEVAGRTDEQRSAMGRYWDEHLAFIEAAFQSIANHTNGLSSCYYRINPEIASSTKGFFFSKNGVSDFQKIELTEIESYDPDDISHVGWYYIPLKQGRPSWVKPYYSAKMQDWVISYAVPIYKAGTFIGVIGMDIKYETLVTQIQQFTNFETGYFALTDNEGTIYYHPEYERGTKLSEVLPQVDEIMKDVRQDSAGQRLNRYDEGGATWQMTFTTLLNGMNLVVAVEESEINTVPDNLTRVFLIAGVLILLVFAIIAAAVMKRVTIPLERLTAAARRLASGDYDAKLDYEGDDEVGVLTSTFRSMRDDLNASFKDLSNKAFTDDLTGVKSKHAYFEATERLNKRIADGKVEEFAVVLFDVNDLKTTNDSLGHEAGDRLLKEASGSICSRFKHSPVYRIGGDEFVAILEGEDFANLEALIAAFEEHMNDNLAHGKVTIASGYACFDSAKDKNYHMVFERADAKMYDRKKVMK